jgi:hypothetical protein
MFPFIANSLNSFSIGYPLMKNFVRFHSRSLNLDEESYSFSIVSVICCTSD